MGTYISALITYAAEAGPSAFFALNVCVTAAGVIPTAPLNISAGVLYGTVYGTCIYVASTTLGAMLLFTLVRTVLRDFIITRLSSYATKIKAIDGAIAKEGMQIVTLLRLSPVMPFGITTAMLSFTSVSATQHGVATAIGLIPSSFAFVYAGAVAKDVASGAEASSMERVGHRATDAVMSVMEPCLGWCMWHGAVGHNAMCQGYHAMGTQWVTMPCAKGTMPSAHAIPTSLTHMHALHVMLTCQVIQVIGMLATVLVTVKVVRTAQAALDACVDENKAPSSPSSIQGRC